MIIILTIIILICLGIITWLLFNYKNSTKLINQNKNFESNLIEIKNKNCLLEEKNNELTNKILKFSEEKEKLKDEINLLTLNQNNDENNKSLIEAAKNHLNEIQEQIILRQNELKSLDGQKENLTASLKLLGEQQSSTTAEFIAKVDKFNEDMRALEGRIVSSQSELTRLEDLKAQLKETIDSIDKDLKEKSILHRAVLDKYQGLVERWEMVPDKKGEKLIEILGEVSELYPELKEDLAGLEWKKIWLPLVQDLCVREGLANLGGIYKLTLKDNEDICYVGQAVDIKKRWYTHIKKMIGVESKGNEKLYRYRPEDFYWEVIEKDGINLNHDEQYWIEYYGCKEIGLNKKL